LLNVLYTFGRLILPHVIKLKIAVGGIISVIDLPTKMVYSKWRTAIGDNFDIVVSGGSAIQSHMAAFFSAINMIIG
jgi:long-subunit acyl-CoA synthetase (AMP-forming)